MSNPVPLSNLQVGDVIYADVIIDKQDMADPNSKSTTAKKYVASSSMSCSRRALGRSPYSLYRIASRPESLCAVSVSSSHLAPTPSK